MNDEINSSKLPCTFNVKYKQKVQLFILQMQHSFFVYSLLSGKRPAKVKKYFGRCMCIIYSVDRTVTSYGNTNLKLK